jgi:hypothetical protein
MRFVDDEDADPADHAVIRARDVLTPLQVESLQRYHDNAGHGGEPLGARPLDAEVQSTVGRGHTDRVWKCLAKVAAQLPHERLGWPKHNGDTFDICIDSVSAHQLDERGLAGTRQHLDGHRGVSSAQKTTLDGCRPRGPERLLAEPHHLGHDMMHVRSHRPGRLHHRHRMPGKPMEKRADVQHGKAKTRIVDLLGR